MATRADLNTEINAQLIDNTAGLITPAILRGVLHDMVDSTLTLSDPITTLNIAASGNISFGSNDVNVTHSTNALAFTGATSGYSFDDRIKLFGAAGDSVLEMRDTAADPGNWFFFPQDFFNQNGGGLHNHTLGLQYNIDPNNPSARVNTAHPAFGWNWEPHFWTGATGLVEHNWSYISIDGLTSYRPFAFNIDTATNNASWDWVGSRMGWRHRNNGLSNSTDALFTIPISTGGGTTTINGSLNVAGISGFATTPINITGNYGGTLLALSPTAMSDLQAAMQLSIPTAVYANGVYAYSAVGTVNTGSLQLQLRNLSTTGGIILDITVDNAAAAGDGYVRWQSGAATFYTLGVDASASRRFKLCLDPFLSAGDVFSVDPATGNVTFTNIVNILSGTAIPAGGTTGSGYKFSSTSNFGVFFGSNAPSLSAAKGSLYLRSDGSGTTDRAYINTDGGTTWTAITTVA